MTLVGLAPVQRFIENIRVTRRLISFEEIYRSSAVASAKEDQEISTIPGGSLISGGQRSRFSTLTKKTNITSGPQVDENVMKKLKRLRRQFLRCEEDSAYVAIGNATMGSAVCVITQGYILMRREGLQYPITTNFSLATLCCFVFGVLWISGAMTLFYPSPHYRSAMDFERGKGAVPSYGLFLLYIARFVNIFMRLWAFAFFTGQFQYWIFLVFGQIWLLNFITFTITRGVGLNSGTLDEKIDKFSCLNILKDMCSSYISIFDFYNGGLPKTRLRYIIYYTFFYGTNAALIGVWYAYFTRQQRLYYFPSLLIIIIVQFGGFILFAIYTYIYSSSRRGLSLCGICCYDSFNEGKAAIEEKIEINSRSRTQLANPGTSILTGGQSFDMSMKDSMFGETLVQMSRPVNARKKNLNRHPSFNLPPSQNSILSNGKSSRISHSTHNLAVRRQDTNSNQRPPMNRDYSQPERRTLSRHATFDNDAEGSSFQPRPDQQIYRPRG